MLYVQSSAGLYYEGLKCIRLKKWKKMLKSSFYDGGATLELNLKKTLKRALSTLITKYVEVLLVLLVIT